MLIDEQKLILIKCQCVACKKVTEQPIWSDNLQVDQDRLKSWYCGCSSKIWEPA